MLKKTIAIVFIIIYLFGCGKDNKQPENKADTKSNYVNNLIEVKSNELVSLNYDPPKGETFRYKISSVSNTTEKISIDSTMSESISQELIYIVKMKVTDKDDEGSILDFEIESIIAKGSSSRGEKFEYNSDNPPKDSVKKEMFYNQELMVKSNFSCRISKKGEILDIYKFDKIVNKVLLKAPKEVSTEQKQMLRENIKEGMLRPILVQLFKVLPNQTVGADSSWSNITKGKLTIFDTEQKAKYKVNKFYSDGDSKLAEVSSSLEVKASGKKEFSENGVQYKFQEPRTRGTGSFFFNMNKNLISRSESNIYFETTVQMKEMRAGGKTGTRTSIVETKSLINLL